MRFLGGTERRRNFALLAFTCVLGLAVLAWLVWPRDEATRTTVGDAVRSFRAEGDAATRGGAREPAPGVYRYATQGGESVKSPIIGTSHDYDGVSTIVLSAGACGQRERWQVLSGRWTEAEACPAQGDGASATVTEFHEFFETAQEDSFHCRSTPVSAKPGARFSSFCRSGDSTTSNRSRVVGTEPVAVGNESFDAAHVVTHSVFEGENEGSATREEWRRRADGLLLRRKVMSEADSSVAGGTHYSERYAIRLLSTEPRR